MTELYLITTKEVPSCLEIGLAASERGDFQLARQMLHTAMEQLDSREDNQIRLVELISHVADTYLHEGNFDAAMNWYMKAFIRCELSQITNSMQAACLLARIAQVHVLRSEMVEFQKSLDNLMLAYLLTEEETLSL